MALHFLQPWLVMAAAAVSVAAGAIGWRTRRAAPMLFALAGAAFFLAGARPQVASKPEDVRHALVIDVSGSMATRKLNVDALADLELPAGHSFVRFELSDAVRQPGGAHGEDTDYARLADVAADPRINGEIILVTDGQGPVEKLYAAVHPHRLILLRAPRPAAPDASIAELSAPTSAVPGTNVEVRATLRCDFDADVPWRLLEGANEVASGVQRVRPGVPANISRAYLVPGSGLSRLRMVLGLKDDREPRNDEATVAIFAGGKRRIEYCTEAGIPEETDALLGMLRADAANGVHVSSILPVSAVQLESVDALIVNNLALPQSGASREQTRALAEWVSKGGSLFMLGSEGAFGPGGYRGSPVEDVMPVRFRPDDAPPHRTLLLMDVSSSMNDPLAGGETKLARLKQAGVRVLDSLATGEQAAVAGFRERIRGEVVFADADSPVLVNAVEGLQAGGSTHIGTSLQQAVDLFDGAAEGSRILLITDGQDVENAGEDAFAAISASLDARSIRLDIVLTVDEDFPWVSWLKGANTHVWSVGDAGFEGLLDTLDGALASGDQEWIVTQPAPVDGVSVALPRFVRCALRHEASVTPSLSVTYSDRPYPLLARRQLVGRTACLCTNSWGGPGMVEFWQDDHFQSELASALQFVLGNAGRTNLVLNRTPEGAELVWTGITDAPEANLRLEPAGSARLDSPGRWVLDWPEGDELRVFDGERLLQRIPLPRAVPAELRVTGDDEVFFRVAEEGGIRVFSSLDSWKPRRVTESAEVPLDLTWLPALVAMLLLLTGFALRRR